jgi:FtsH-binding integral membrane protein
MFYTETVYKSASEINSAMGRVYNQMVLAIINSMVVSFLVSSSTPLMQMLFATPLKWLVIFAPLAAVLAITFLQDKMNRTQAIFALHGFAALMGLSFATIFVVYSIGSIASAFFGASILFVCMSVYGYFTKRSLDSFGQFLFIGLIAIVIASIINIFVGSTVAQMVISAIAVLIFTGLTAYDTQKIREMISIENDGKAEVMGALTLYLDFINIFLNLLQLFGNKE